MSGQGFSPTPCSTCEYGLSVIYGTKRKRYIRVPDIRDSDEDLERVLLVGLADAAFDIAFDLRLALFAVAAQSNRTCQRTCKSTHIVCPRRQRYKDGSEKRGKAGPGDQR